MIEIANELENRNYAKFKLRSLQIAEKYESFNGHKAEKIYACGNALWFDLLEHIKTKDRKLKLTKAYFCKNRFCDFCNWRRSLKYIKIISNNLKELEKDYKFIFLTLTVKNCKLENLKKTISDMNFAFKQMLKEAKFKNAFDGYLKSLEITVNKKERTLHPHFHIVLATNEDYFFKSSRKYIKNTQFSELWKKHLKVNYIPVVDIRKVGNCKSTNDIQFNKVVLELVKYSIKNLDIQDLSNLEFKELDKQLHHMRFFNSGGILKNATKQIENAENCLSDNNEFDENIYITLLKDIIYIFRNYKYNLGSLEEARPLTLEEKLDLNIITKNINFY